MKLVKGIIAATLMMVASVGAASAEGIWNTSTSLVLTAWQQTNSSTFSANELGLNLVNTNSENFLTKYMGSANSNLWTQVGTIDSSLVGNYSLSDLRVSVYGRNMSDSLSTLPQIAGYNVTGTVLFATNSNTANYSYSLSLPYTNGSNTSNNISYYNTKDTDKDGDAVGLTADPGADAKDLTSRMSTEALLSNVATQDVILYLYAADYNTKGYVYVNGGASIAKVKITADGGVYMSTVPVPGAVWLLGSALLGAVGLRRKNA